MTGFMKAALCAATFLCAGQAHALTFTVAPDAPVGLFLPSNGSQDNRILAFSAVLDAAVATSFTLSISTYDAPCAANPICAASFPNGQIASTSTFAVAAGRTILQDFRYSLPGSRPGDTRDVSVLFSTSGSTPITFSNVTQPAGFTSLVPEPSTWALMIAGFGLTGYALRRRRANVAFA